MSNNEKDDIIQDYGEMYDNWIDYGMGEEEVEVKLGKPNSIIKELVEGYRKVTSPSVEASKNNSKVIAITPFISLVAFFIIGFGFDGWIYGWMAFLLIPITAITLEMGKDPHKFTALMPFVSLLVFFYLGFVHDLWHPGWLVFMSIPLVAIMIERKSIGTLNTLVSLSPLVVTVVYLYLGFESNLWVEAWPLFLIVPALGVLNEKSILKIFVWELFIIGGALGYLYIGYTYAEWGYALLTFIPLVIFGLLQEDVEINGNMSKEYKMLVIASLVIYVLLGYLTKEWGYFWIVFLSVPVYAIMHETKGNPRTIALTPFIAIVIFFTLGWWFGFWAYAWIAFLIIPIVAIIKEA
jgi:hypothetical protein